MKRSRRSLALLLAGSAALLGLGAAVAPASLAATPSPFDPADNGATQGTITLYDASGNLLTSGTAAEVPAYAVADDASFQPLSGTPKKATVFAATPVKGQNPFTWPIAQISTASDYPPASPPASLQGKPNAINSTIVQWFDPDTGYQGPNGNGLPNQNTDPAWQNYYQLRMAVSSPSSPPNAQVYASATLAVDALGNWEVSYPDASSGSAPTVSTPAAITGTAKVGKTLTCAAAFDGSPTPTLAYRWKRGTSEISGATKSTYKAVAADANKNVTCVVTATNTLGNVSSTSPAKKVALGDALKATTKPTISGKARVGKALTCKSGRWTPGATSYKYQWLRNGKTIKGKTSSKYKVVKADKGDKLSCKVTATKAGYRNGVATSAAKKVAS